MSTEPEPPFAGWHADPEYRDPLPSDLKRPEFEAVWRAIKDWDISRRPNPKGPRLYSGAEGNDVMHILDALPSKFREEQRVRENIAAYFHYIASVEVGTVLTPAGREIVGFCGSWVTNRLDEKWLEDKVVPFPSSTEPAGIDFPAPEVRHRGIAQRGQTVERSPVVLDGEPSDEELTLAEILGIVLQTEETLERRSESPAEATHRQSVAYASIRDLVRSKAGLGAARESVSTVEAVRAIVRDWESATVGQTAGSQAAHAARHLDRIRALVQGGRRV